MKSSHRECVLKLVNKYRQEEKGFPIQKKGGGVNDVSEMTGNLQSPALFWFLFYRMTFPPNPQKKKNLLISCSKAIFNTEKHTHKHTQKPSHQIQPSLSSPYFGNPHTTPCSLYCCNSVSDSTAHSSSALLLCRALTIVWSLFCRGCAIETEEVGYMLQCKGFASQVSLQTTSGSIMEVEKTVRK